MAITELERLRLHEHFKGTMGEEQAATLMECLPPAGWGDIATKHDLKNEIELTRKDLKNEIELTRKDLTNEIEGVRKDLTNEIEGVRKDLKNEIEAVRNDLTREIAHLREWAEVKFDGVATKESVAELRGELHRLMRTQMFGFFLATAASLSLIRAFG